MTTSQTLTTVRAGSTGKDTSKCQALLNAHGEALNLDGVAGPKTVVAIQRFQRRHGLKATGICGQTVWNLLIYG